MTDIERQGIAITQSAEQYGATDSKKVTNDTAEKLPLLLGRWTVAPDQICRIGFAVFVAWFVIHRTADFFYILSIDGRFPEGLGHLYPSEAQRVETVSYTRQVLLLGLCHRCLVFGAVVAMAYFQLFARFDDALRCFFRINSCLVGSQLREGVLGQELRLLLLAHLEVLGLCLGSHWALPMVYLPASLYMAD